MRSIWKGAISFGLVTIPVKLYAATDQHNISFHQVHREDGGRVRFKRVCTACGEEVPYADIAKGYELPSGEMVVLTDEDLADVPLSTSRQIDVLQFTPLDQVDPIYFNKSYYLEPESAGTKPYLLLRDALERSGKVAVVKLAIRQREQLAALRVRDGVFVLETMLWPDEVRTTEFPFLDEEVDVRAQELQMATSLIDSMTADFEPGEHTDAYRAALQEVIEAKIEGKQLVRSEAGPEEALASTDLLGALRASVEAVKKDRKDGGGAGPGDTGKGSETGADTGDEAGAGPAPDGAEAATGASGKRGDSAGSSGAKSSAKKSGKSKTASTRGRKSA